MSRRYERWDRSGMPSGAEMARIQAGISQTMAGAIQDARNGISKSGSMMPPERQRDEASRPASGGSVDIKPPAGVEHVDRIAESFAQQDRIAAIRQKSRKRLDRIAPRSAKPVQGKNRV